MNDREWVQLIRELIETDVEKSVDEIVGFSNYADNYSLAEQFLIELSTNINPNIKGISVLGLGHLARVHKQSSDKAVSVVKAALLSTDSYISGHADSAADDISHFSKHNVKA